MTGYPPAATEDPAPANVDPLEEFLCFSVYSAGLAFNRAYKPLLDEHGLTYPQYLVLVALSGRAEQSVGSLGERLHLESNTLTPLLKRLEAAGLVTRSRDKRDERVVLIGLSQQGADLAERLRSCVPAAILGATGLTGEALQVLNDALRKLGTTLRNGS